MWQSAIDSFLERVVSQLIFRTGLKMVNHSTLVRPPENAEFMTHFDVSFIGLMFWQIHIIQSDIGTAAPYGYKIRAKRQVPLFPPIYPLEFIISDIVGLFLRSKPGNQFSVKITDRHSRHTCAIPIAMITPAHVTDMWLNRMIIHYRIPSSILSDNGKWPISKYFSMQLSWL